MAGNQVSQLEPSTEPTLVLLRSELKAKAIISGLKHHKIHNTQPGSAVPEQLRLYF